MPECSEFCTPAVVDAAAGHDGHVAVVSDQEIVIYRLRQTALAQHHRDVDRLVLVPGLMMMSMPSLSSLETMSMLAVVFRAAALPFARML